MGNITYTTAGNDLIDASSPVTVPLTTACWPQGLPDGMTEVVLNDMVATQLDSTLDGFQYNLSFTGAELGLYSLDFFNSGGKIGFKKREDGQNNGVGGVTLMTLDMTNGELLVNMIDDRDRSSDSYRRLMRMRVTGTVNSSYEFTALNALEGFLINSSMGFNAVSGSNNNYFGASVMGTAASGYLYKSMSRNDGATDTVNASKCEGSTDSCASVTPLLFVGGANSFFNVTSSWASYITSSKPLCDDGSSITLDILAVNGPLGVCQ